MNDYEATEALSSKFLDAGTCIATGYDQKNGWGLIKIEGKTELSVEDRTINVVVVEYVR